MACKMHIIFLLLLKHLSFKFGPNKTILKALYTANENYQHIIDGHGKGKSKHACNVERKAADCSKRYFGKVFNASLSNIKHYFLWCIFIMENIEEDRRVLR